MRETVSNHLLPIQDLSRTSSNGFHSDLKTSLFTKLLRTVLDTRAALGFRNKRKASSYVESSPRSKRTKTSQGWVDIDPRVDNSASGGTVDVTQAREAQETIARKMVPTLEHTLAIQFQRSNLSTDGDDQAPSPKTGESWLKEDEELQSLLSAFSESHTLPETIDLGSVYFGCDDKRDMCISNDPRFPFTNNKGLFRVPSLAIDADANDIHSPLSVDLLMAAQMLHNSGRAHLEANLAVTIYPPGSDTVTYPFSLLLKVKVSVILPDIMTPVPQKRQSKKNAQALEDAQRRVLRAAYLSDEVTSDVHGPITVSTFYSIMNPAPQLPTTGASDAMQPKFLVPTLLPFQRRSVAWLLEREGMTITSEGKVVPQKTCSNFSFWETIDIDGETGYFNRLSGELLDHDPAQDPVYGGMLAEEPGLGKTVETIALMLLNPAPPEWNPSLSRWDTISRLDVKAVKSTLIVTPSSLATQWKAELGVHAPSLRVLFYDGWTKVRVPITKTERELERFAELEISSKEKKNKGRRKAGKQKALEDDLNHDGSFSRSDNGDILEWCDYVHQFDVVITTYNILRAEIHVARPAPDRPRREDALYSPSARIRSPLVMVEWKRVVMDEVQMVGGGSAAEMVSLIPRLSSLAVSGTPAKSQMSDLIHVLKFLRIDQVVGSLRLWNRLLKPGFTSEFSAFLRHYGIRTTKSEVTGELTIPQQTRYLVAIELGKVERHVYDQNLETVLLQLGLDSRGVAATSGWEADVTLLRSAIRRLRGICTHPQIGQLQRKGDNIYKPGVLKTIDAVLRSMQEQNWKNLMEDWKAKVHLLIRHAQLQQKDEAIPNRYHTALRTLELAEGDINKLIEEIKDVLAKHDEKGKVLKEEAAVLRHQREYLEDIETDVDGKGKGKAIETYDDKVEEDTGDEDPEETGLPKTPAGEEHRVKRRALKQRLRDSYLTLHMVKFLQGDLNHVLGKSQQEDAAYQAAENLRRNLLKATEDEANKAIAVLQGGNQKEPLSLNGLIIGTPFFGQGGIRSADLMHEVNTLVEAVFNAETDLLWKWRSHVLSILSKPLNSKDEEVDGQEYQRTLDDQGEAETYLQAYSVLLADRRQALVNERTLLATHDVREKQLRHTKAAMKAATAADEGLDLEAVEGLEIQPEHEVLHKDLSTLRKDLLVQLNGRSVKTVLIELSGILVKIAKDKDPEKIIVKDAVEQLRLLIAEQTILHNKLEADLTLLRKAFNQRILYFRQLQEISDSVAEVEWEEETVMAAIQVCVTQKAELEAKINTTRARQRYLENLSEDKDNKKADEEEANCILCRHDFVRGFITQCAHIFCEECMKAWLSRKEGKTCPVCRFAINPDTVQRFTVNAKETEPPPQPVDGEATPQSHRKINYNRIDPKVFEEILSMETYGDYGSKIQTLVRHIAHLKHSDPGAKSIVFSAWADSLHIVERALTENGIQCLRIDQGSKNTIERFTKNPNILVLLLHGERENAGLNVTCASRVFLLESVVHHSFEIQAIARIDRLGQTRPTEVYCYYSEDTIERNILDLAARKGLSLYTKENSSGTVSVSPFAKENEIGIDNSEKRRKGTVQKGDFIFKVDDMLAILFPHMFEELEYLLPSMAVSDPTSEGDGVTSVDKDRDVEMVDVSASSSHQTGTPRSIQINAVAGPSRLR